MSGGLCVLMVLSLFSRVRLEWGKLLACAAAAAALEARQRSSGLGTRSSRSSARHDKKWWWYCTSGTSDEDSTGIIQEHGQQALEGNAPGEKIMLKINNDLKTKVADISDKVLSHTDIMCLKNLYCSLRLFKTKYVCVRNQKREIEKTYQCRMNGSALTKNK